LVLCVPTWCASIYQIDIDAHALAVALGLNLVTLAGHIVLECIEIDMSQTLDVEEIVFSSGIVFDEPTRT
jgi:hypothetical protein